jgi:hypothetical protein
MGGVFERMIQTIKKVFNALLLGARLNDEILITVMCEAENLVNSRPITKVIDDSCDPLALSPNQLLLLKGGTSPIPGVFGVADLYNRRWRHVQHLADTFWKRWLKEYLPQLQKASKWQEQYRNVQINDIVLLVDENMPRGLWPIGVVTEVKQSEDGLVRSAKVKTQASELVRPINKLVWLEGNVDG